MGLKKLIPILAFVGAILLGSLAMIAFVHPQTNTSNKIRIVAAFYPLAEFARQAGGPFVDVTTVVPNGIEPHEFEPMPKNIIDAENANIFIYNGSGLDPWAAKIAQDLAKKNVASIDASKLVSLLPLEPGSDLKNATTDPHFWLDPVQAQSIVNALRAQLIALDPKNTKQYNQYAGNYLSQLAQLDRQFASGLSNCAVDTIVTSHAAFQYLSHRYHFQVYSVSGISPDAEPSPKTLADLVRVIKEQHINYVLTETLVNPKLADALAKETNAKTLTFNPLEGLTSQDEAKNRNYISVMKDNLSILQTALTCQ